jgi:hypothetical protein
MFDMRFELRRRWSRLAFCLICLAPTLFIMGAIAFTRNPLYVAARHAALEASLSVRLGLTVEAQSFTRRGQHWVVRGLELRDPETEHWALRAASVEYAKTAAGDVLLVHQAELCAKFWPRVWSVLHEHLLQRPRTCEPDVLVSAETLTMRYDQQADTLHRVRCELVSRAEGAEALFEFCLPGNESGEPARLRLIRNRQITPPTTAWELYSGDSAIPCSLAEPWFASVARLGAGSSFSGKIWAEQGNGNWTADASGTFHDVQLEQLVTSQFPHKLSGRGDVTFQQICVHRGRIVELAGDLQAHDGVVSRSLLTAARDELRLSLRDPIDDSALLRYERLAVGFTLNSQGMVLLGMNPPDESIMSDAYGPLLSGKGEVLSPVAFLRLLVPQNEVHVPATQETASLVRMLPLPEAGTRSYGTVRLLD